MDQAASNSATVVSATTIVAGLVAVFVLVLLLRPKREKKKRRFSYTSAAMAIGGFPEKANFPDPVINAALFFDDPPTLDDLTAKVVPKMLQFERFKTIPLPHQRSSRPCAGMPIDHAHFVRVFEVKGDDEVMRCVRDHLHDPLSKGGRPADLPWWELLLIKNTGKGQSALIWRVHHSLGDGLSMLSVIETVIEHKDGTPLRSMRDEFSSKKQQHQKANKRMPWYQIFAKALQALFSILVLPNSPYDDDTLFSPGGKKQLIHSQNRDLIIFPTVPLDFVKQLKTAAKCSLNDVLYTCLSQGIHDYLEHKQDPKLQEKGEKLLCRTLMPVVMPRPHSTVQDPTETLRNTFAFISADFGVGYSDIMGRLRHVNDIMMNIKRSLLLPVGLWVQNSLLSNVPHFINQQVVLDIWQRHSCIFSNVPGPSKACLFAGKEVVGVGMYFSNLVPQTGFLSYNGKIYGCLCLDPDTIPDSHTFPIWYCRALVELASQLKVPVPKDVEIYAERKC